MKVLIVCSGNAEDFKFQLHQAFVYEQIEALKKYRDVDYDTFFIKGKGVIGYLKNLRALRTKLREGGYDILHAHFGLSGLLAVLQSQVPVVLTLHGSDINNKNNRMISLLARRMARATIFVSEKMTKGITKTNKDYIIPCGVNLDEFYPVEKGLARQKLELKKSEKYILFSSSFNNPVKNYSLALNSVKLLEYGVEIIELKNKSRQEMNLLFCAADLLLLTSFSEGSPQVIKEAMACNCPIVATDVGDIREVIGDIEGCFVTDFNPQNIADQIGKILSDEKRTVGRERILKYDNTEVAGKIINIYNGIKDNIDHDY